MAISQPGDTYLATDHLRLASRRAFAGVVLTLGFASTAKPSPASSPRIDETSPKPAEGCDRMRNQLMLTTVLSGGQTGVDTAALRAALRAGLAIGGHVPPNRTTELGPGTVPAEFAALKETPVDRSVHAPDVPRSARTELNVMDADAVLIIRLASQTTIDRGTAFTASAAVLHFKPLLVIDPCAPGAAEKTIRWLAALDIRVVDVAGPSEGTTPGIEAIASRFLDQVFRA